MKKKLSFLLFCFLAFSVSGQLKFEKQWEFSGASTTLPAWIGSNTERSMAVYNEKLYIVSRNGGNKLLIINKDGNLERTVTMTGLTSGTLTGNNIGITSDGSILVGNAGAQSFAIQVVNETTGAASNLLSSASTNIINGGRIDGWCVNGTLQDGYIAVPVSYLAGTTNGGNEILIFLLNEGTVSNPTSPIRISNTNGVGASASAVDATHFYAFGKGISPVLFEKDSDNEPEWVKSTDQFGSVKPGSESIGGAQFTYQNKTYFVSPGNNQFGALEIFDITNGLSQATSVYTTLPLGNVANNFAYTCPVAVEVKAYGVMIYVLATNNGIAAYKLSDSSLLSGTYKVGTGGDYTTLHEAVADIKAKKASVVGDIVLEIISDITETANLPLALDMEPYTLTIRPDKDENRTITFSSSVTNAGGIAGSMVFGVDALNTTATTTTGNIIIDGFAGNETTRRLTIATSASSATQNHPVTIYGDVNNITIKNCIIKHAVTITNTANNYAICLRRSSDVWPENVVIENNEIINMAGTSSDGISPDLGSSGGTGYMTGLAIKNNTIRVRARGIIAGYVDGLEISGNIFDINQSSSGLTSACILGFGNLKGAISVKNNYFTGMKTANAVSEQGFKAIVTEGASAVWYIDNNFFTGFQKTSTTGSSNFIGIDCVTPSFVRHNTFLMNKMTNTATNYTAVRVKAGIQPEIKNNIFISKEDAGTNTLIHGVSDAVSDYNLFFFDNTNEKTTIDGTNRTLTAYQTNTGKDANSVFMNVDFVNPQEGNLHLANTAIGNVDLLVPAISGVATDIDGDTRENPTYTGADVPVAPVISTPAALSATNITQNGFKAQWSGVPSVSIYKLNVYTKSPLTYILENHEVDATSFEVTGLNPATNYYYTVRASDGTFYSDYSNEIGVRTIDEPLGDGVAIANFVISPYFDEQVLAYDYNPNIKVEINAPPVVDFDPDKPTAIVMYGLPNGNSTDWTIGKLQGSTGEDWHYQIQHIGAQTRYVRNMNPGFNLVTVYMETAQQSWGTWRSSTTEADRIIKQVTEDVLSLFADYQPYIVLNGHSGGGNFPFGFMDAVTEIPSYVKRISFLDSNYNWDATRYGNKLKKWLEDNPDNRLCVIAYNDSVALLDGAPIVSATGGTWYRSRIMQQYLKDNMPGLNWTETEDDNMITYSADNNRIQFLLKQNPTKAILHTVLVEKNGYIQSLLSGTPLEEDGYAFYGNHAYDNLIQSATVYPHILRIPPRKTDALGGAAFMEKVKNMTLENRENEIYKELSSGNIPNSHRQTTRVTEMLTDANSVNHMVEYYVLPDFLTIGSDNDLCRIPMLPATAQRLASNFGATLPTSKLSDLNHKNAVLKMDPKTMTPDATMTTVPVFVAHNTFIEEARILTGKPLNSLIAGHKKDIVISNRLVDAPNSVIIYGWHYPNGTAIQPIYTGHSANYVDYSHGARMVNQEVLVDGVNMKIRNILRDNIQYKMLSNESGAMTQTEYSTGGTTDTPKAPKVFAVIPESSSSVKILLNSAQPTEDYKVLYGTDVLNLNMSLNLNMQSPVIGGLEPDVIYYFALQASNTAGSSPVSEKLAAVPTSADVKVLIVNGFDRVMTGNIYNFVKEHGKAFKEHGYPFASASNDAIIAGLVDLTDYELVDYILGEESTADKTFDATEQSLVKTFLTGGGKLLATGAEIGWDLGRTASDAASKEFMKNYLKFSYAEDNPGGSAGVGQYHGISIIPGLSFGDDSYTMNFADGTNGTEVRYPDVLKPETGAVGFMQYMKDDVPYSTEIGYAATAYTGVVQGGTAESKVIVSGVPFESIYPETGRTELMKRMIDYFGLSPYSNIESTESPKFYLGQNHPNPARDITYITYYVTEHSRVQLSVWNVNGLKVASLVDTYQNQGVYTVPCNVDSFADGVYFYRLDTGSYTETKKMIVNRK